MASRKLMQEVEKCYKKVSEGVEEFNNIYDKIEQSNNPAQKEKLEDNLKREIKKLQRLRDQIKTWAASNDVKDKDRLLDNRRLIETQMEKFKAVEKAMKTKAYSKEGLSAAAKLDPKEQAKVETGEFLAGMVDELEHQVEALEAEQETIQATMKKGKANRDKAERVTEIERLIERHKWHQGRLELIRRSLENGGLEVEQVKDIEESIRYYVSDGVNDDFMEDEEMYDDLDLDGDEEVFGMALDGEKGSTEDARSTQDENAPDHEIKPPSSSKPRTAAESAMASAGGRRPSTQLKSPLPTLATLHTPAPAGGSGSGSGVAMKPASLPSRPAGEGLKYASAAAAAAAAEKNVGIAPLPPPPGMPPATGGVISPLPPAHVAAHIARSSAASSPAMATAQPSTQAHAESKPTAQQQPASADHTPASSKATPAQAKAEPAKASSSRAAGKAPAAPAVAPEPTKVPHVNGNGNGVNGIKPIEEETEEEEPRFHLPACLSDLLDSYEATRKRPPPASSPAAQRMLAVSRTNAPDVTDADLPRQYRPDVRLFPSASNFPQTPLAIFDDPRLYGRIDPDTLFYVFYYKQGTHQQYLAAKALKDQSWRFHKQYQTWFQRHEEPKSITEEFEQGTYRFFDYESTWMNRRKADFKFAYKFLEDDI
ncbi:related to general negative regulator of transcription, subunit 3 (NOT3) [Cephalotrichum gorgonifer]|uniref:General negative regulator of transcription subunit n=1 Tax=Cephalotrichum gorgonifer TaxID=2041049 RepID=A0AAE8N6P5_9PEZI|nr:related to general negative regulator of transcription, subunit 3 (NOT3) [Cephalotrichum gorgonifer]